MNTETGANCEFGPCETCTATTEQQLVHIVEVLARINNILRAQTTPQTQFIRIHQATPATLVAEAIAGGWDNVADMLGGWDITEEEVYARCGYIPADTEYHSLDVSRSCHVYVTLLTNINGEPMFVRDVVAWVAGDGELWVDSEDFA